MKKQVSLFLSICGVLFLFIIGFRIAKPGYCSPALSSRGSLPVISKNEISPGFMLVSPLYPSTDERPNPSVHNSYVYLIDVWGHVVHKWKTYKTAFTAMMDKDGYMWASIIDPPGKGLFWLISTSRLQKFDWDGNVIWEYENEQMHHDFDVLDDGRVALIVRERVPKSIAKKIQGGSPGSEYDGDVWADSIVEVDKDKNVQWVWHAYDYMAPDKYPMAQGQDRFAWTHNNSVRYMEKNPIDGTPAYMTSLRNISRVMIIRHSDKEVIWESPPGMFSRQHDATLLDNGHILVFNNNAPFSKVMEVDPKTNTVVWEYTGGDSLAGKIQFFSAVMGAAQRMPNGNTIITASTSGQVFEVTPDKRVVWDMASPFGREDAHGPYLESSIFRARRYGPSEIKWPAKLPDPISSWPETCSALLNGDSRPFFK